MAEFASVSKNIRSKPAGRYDGNRSNTRPLPGGRAQTNARIRTVQPVEAAVDDPYEARDRILVTVNRRVDILETERSHARISEAAYRTGRIVQAVFERMGNLQASNWCGTSRVDPMLAQELKVLRSIESAEKIVALMDSIKNCLGMIDTRLLRRVLGDRMSYAECAEFQGKSGERGTTYVAGRFRDGLEELAKSWAGKGRAKSGLQDKYSAMATENPNSGA